jgi:hypothetical protein
MLSTLPERKPRFSYRDPNAMLRFNASCPLRRNPRAKLGLPDLEHARVAVRKVIAATERRAE